MSISKPTRQLLASARQADHGHPINRVRPRRTGRSRASAHLPARNHHKSRSDEVVVSRERLFRAVRPRYIGPIEVTTLRALVSALLRQETSARCVYMCHQQGPRVRAGREESESGGTASGPFEYPPSLDGARLKRVRVGRLVGSVRRRTGCPLRSRQRVVASRRA